MECHGSKESIGARLRKDDVVGGPVTCVSLAATNRHKHCCWVARGPWVEIVQLHNANSRNRLRYLAFPDGGTVHGVRQCPTGEPHIVAVFGGRQVCFVVNRGFDSDEPLKPVPLVYQQRRYQVLTLSDWIWDVHVIRKNAESMETLMAVALANNTVEMWKLTRFHIETIAEDLIFEASRCMKIAGNTRCITYSMSFVRCRRNDDSDLTVASGTVSNEVLIWTVLTASEITNCWDNAEHTAAFVRRQEIARLTGHEGVIHSVAFNSEGDAVVSTSDDRTVRLWQRHGASWRHIWTAWGHTARVWSAAFASCGVVSSGEDSSVRVWSFDTGLQLAECRNYSCQSQWCLDVLGDFTIVGSNDGSAKLYDLSSRVVKDFDGIDTCGPRTGTFLIPDDPGPSIDEKLLLATDAVVVKSDDEVASDKKNNKKKPKEITASQIVCGMKFYIERDSKGRRKILVATRGGTLTSLCLRTGVWTLARPWWNKSLLNVRAGDGSCIALNKCGTLLAVGTTRGHIVLLRNFDADATSVHDTVLDSTQYRSVQSLHWLNDETLLSFHIKGVVLYWSISRHVPVNGSLQYVLDTTTKALPLSFAFDKNGGNLFIGDSRGNIAAFRLESDHPEICVEMCAFHVVRRVHKTEHVIEMIFSQDRRLLSVGNDGCIHTCFVDLEGSIRRSISVPVSSLSGLSHVWLVQDEHSDDRIIVGGYHANWFVAVDATSGYELFRVDTGGRQRGHDCFISASASSSESYGLAVCVSRKDGPNCILLQSFLARVDLREQPNIIQNSVGVSLHGEPIFDACFFTTGGAGHQIALLTGGEDCSARVSIYKDATLVASTLLPPQESSVRAVAASRHISSSSTVLVVGGGKLTVQFFLLEHDGELLNISMLGRGQFPLRTSIDHRINAVAAIPLVAPNGGEMHHLVAIGDSNGSLSIFLISEGQASRPISVACHEVYSLSRPIFSIEIIRTGERFFILVGTSAGEVLLWEFPVHIDSIVFDSFPLSPIGKYAAHQMGTNSISAVTKRGLDGIETLSVCSGGDDQAITMCQVELHGQDGSFSREANVIDISTLRDSSFSALKGVRFINTELLLSVGYSQRLCLWRRKAGNKLELIDVKQVDIADVNCLAALSSQERCDGRSEDILAVLGEGLELFSVDGMTIK